MAGGSSRQAVVLTGAVQQCYDIRSGFGRDTAAGIEVAADGAGDAVFVDLAYIDELVAILRCPVIPVLEQFGNFREVKAQPATPHQAGTPLGGRKWTAVLWLPGGERQRGYNLVMQN